MRKYCRWLIRWDIAPPPNHKHHLQPMCALCPGVQRLNRENCTTSACCKTWWTKFSLVFSCERIDQCTTIRHAHVVHVPLPWLLQRSRNLPCAFSARCYAGGCARSRRYNHKISIAMDPCSSAELLEPISEQHYRILGKTICFSTCPRPRRVVMW